jgi:hypothetical protein
MHFRGDHSRDQAELVYDDLRNDRVAIESELGLSDLRWGVVGVTRRRQGAPRSTHLSTYQPVVRSAAARHSVHPRRIADVVTRPERECRCIRLAVPVDQ